MSKYLILDPAETVDIRPEYHYYRHKPADYPCVGCGTTQVIWTVPDIKTMPKGVDTPEWRCEKCRAATWLDDCIPG